MLLHHHYYSSISLFALKCYTFFLLLPANTCRFHLTVSGFWFAALLLELLQLCNTLATRTKAHGPGGPGEEGYSTSSSQILSRGFLFPDRRRRRTNSAEYSSITENQLCVELAKYSALPVSLSCFHSGTVCSCVHDCDRFRRKRARWSLVVTSLFSVVQRSQTPARALA